MFTTNGTDLISFALMEERHAENRWLDASAMLRTARLLLLLLLLAVIENAPVEFFTNWSLMGFGATSDFDSLHLRKIYLTVIYHVYHKWYRFNFFRADGRKACRKQVTRRKCHASDSASSSSSSSSCGNRERARWIFYQLVIDGLWGYQSASDFDSLHLRKIYL